MLEGDGREVWWGGVDRKDEFAWIKAYKKVEDAPIAIHGQKF